MLTVVKIVLLMSASDWQREQEAAGLIDCKDGDDFPLFRYNCHPVLQQEII